MFVVFFFLFFCCCCLPFFLRFCVRFYFCLQFIPNDFCCLLLLFYCVLMLLHSRIVLTATDSIQLLFICHFSKLFLFSSIFFFFFLQFYATRFFWYVLIYAYFIVKQIKRKTDKIFDCILLHCFDYCIIQLFLKQF